MKKRNLVFILFLAGFLVVSGLCLAQKADSQSTDKTAEGWQREFSDICSKTQDAMAYSVEELKILIHRCELLQPQIEKLDETERKVYSRRLAQCRGVFEYVLDSKQKDKK